MNTRNLPAGIDTPLYEIQLSPHPFFTKDFSVDAYSFKITSLSYYGGRVFITITLNNTPLCLNHIARLGIDMAYVPILTLDGHKHVLFLDSPHDISTPITYDMFGTRVNLYYGRAPYYDKDRD